ncbi:MAG: response regulator [Bacteroidia bacterium]|nr:response regulator [Bacteroidia bacterium]
MKNVINAIIIDDERFNRELICDFILKLNPAFHIIGETDNIISGYELIKRLKPDLIFLDIKMPKGNGFELLEKFDSYDFEVVFITGFDQYAIKAFEFNAMDYVLKPIDQSKFSQTLHKVKARFDNKFSNVNNLKSVIKSYDRKEFVITKIPIHHKHEVILLSIDEMIYIKAEEGCTVFFTTSNKRYISSRKLNEFEFIVDTYINFVQINKGVYINLNFIKSYSKGAVCIVKMLNDTTFEVSRRKKTEILAILDRQ